MPYYHVSTQEYGTGHKVEITIKGRTQTLEVCKIPLDILYLDDDSERFIEYVDNYNNSHRESLCDIWSGSREAYNEKMEGFVKALEEEGALSVTAMKKDIAENGQTTPGCVHSDGRIKDGNVRFVALRELAREGHEEYFYAVIVGYDY